MSIRFQCPKCEKVLRASEAHAGKVATCKQCQTKLRVPTTKTSSVSQPAGMGANLAAPTKLPSPTKVKPSASSESPSHFEPSAGSTPSAKAKRRPAPPAEPASGDTDSLFGDLPEFQTFDQPVAKPRSVDDEFREAMAAGTRTHYDGQSPPTSSQDSAVTGFDTAAATTPNEAASFVDSTSPVSAVGADGGDVWDSMTAAVDVAVKRQLKTNAAVNAPKISVAQVKAAFAGELQDFDRGEGAKFQAICVAASMILLPIAFVISVIVYTAVVFALPFGALPISFATFMKYGGVIVYPLMLVLMFALWIPVFSLIGAILSLAFVSSEPDKDARTLTQEDQPVMYEFVTQICEKVGAPAPSRIDLDSNFNASASFRNGWMSFGKNELVLKLGVPLIASQSAAQLGSVIAHEFGHFRQGSGMRSTYLVRSLAGWFFERAFLGQLRADLIDYYQDAEESNDSILAVFSFIGWLGRKIMLCFGYIGHVLAGSLSREMEYDADRHAVHVAGTKNFIESMANIERFGVAHGLTIENLRMLYASSGVLIENIPRFMIYIGDTMSNGVVRRIADEKQKEKQDRFDTHPPTRDRVNAAKELNQAGVLKMPRPASDLVRNWTSVCESTTLEFYSQVIGEPIEKNRTTRLENVLKAEHKILLDNRPAT